MSLEFEKLLYTDDCESVGDLLTELKFPATLLLLAISKFNVFIKVIKSPPVDLLLK